MHPELEGKPDDELVALALEGSQGAMEVLYERYRAPLMGYAYRLTGERALAEDVFHNAFTYFVEHLDRYEPRGKLSAYLFRIVQSYGADAKTAERRMRATASVPERVYTSPDTDGDVEGEASEKKVRSALEALPDHLRQVVELRLYQGLDYSAVAEAAGVSEATARSRMRYALEALRDTLGLSRRPEKPE